MAKDNRTGFHLDKGYTSVEISSGGKSVKMSADEFDSIVKNPPGVIGEAPDYSDYTEYWTIPKRVLAKRLTEAKSIRIVKNGVEGWLDGEPGHIHVVDTSGDAAKEMLFSEQDFEKKFSKLKIQRSLFDKEND